MKLSAQSHASIASSLREAVDKYIADGERTVVTDIHLQPKQDSGELVIFNDDDEELSRTIIEEWVDYSEDDFLYNSRAYTSWGDQRIERYGSFG